MEDGTIPMCFTLSGARLPTSIQRGIVPNFLRPKRVNLLKGQD